MPGRRSGALAEQIGGQAAHVTLSVAGGLDASADATVDVGAALYFYNTADQSFLKIAEYESLDFVLPNRAILEALSVMDGKLAYNGALVGTVQAGTNEW